MSDAESEKPQAAPPSLPPDFPLQHERKSSAALKWGLVGCAGLSALLIVALIVFVAKAPTMMSWLLARQGDQVLALCTKDVPPKDQDRFREALEKFSREASRDAERVTLLQGKIRTAIDDRNVTPEELADLTTFLSSKKPGP